MITSHPARIESKPPFVEYECVYELLPLEQNKKFFGHSLVVQLRYDPKNHACYGVLNHEVDGNSCGLANFSIPPQEFFNITGHRLSADEKLNLLRNRRCSATLADGVITLEDGTSITL